MVGLYLTLQFLCSRADYYNMRSALYIQIPIQLEEDILVGITTLLSLPIGQSEGTKV